MFYPCLNFEIKGDYEMLSERKPIVEQCKGCKDIDGEFCKCYLDPSILFRRGLCPRADHLKVVVKDKAKKRIGQQKQRKRK